MHAPELPSYYLLMLKHIVIVQPTTLKCLLYAATELGLAPRLSVNLL